MSDVLKQMAAAGSIDLSKAVKDSNYAPVVDQIHDEIVLSVNAYVDTIHISYSPHATAQITCCKDCDEWSQDIEKYPLRNLEEGFCCVHHCFTGHQYYCGDARRKNNEQIH